jgi:hypothetical protein
MQLTQRFPYNPKWHNLVLGLLLFGGGAFFMAYMAGHPEEGLHSVPVLLGRSGAASFYWVAASLSAALAALTLLLIARRFVIARFLELQQNELVLPRGWFNTRHIRIPYAQIERVWERKISGQSLLFVAAAGRRYKINSSLLPNDAIYSAIRDCLFTYAKTLE